MLVPRGPSTVVHVTIFQKKVRRRGQTRTSGLTASPRVAPRPTVPRLPSMKLTAILLLKWNGDSDPCILGQACDLSSFGFFQRGAVKEMISFVGRTVAKRTQRGQRQTVQQVRTPAPTCSPLIGTCVSCVVRRAYMWFKSGCGRASLSNIVTTRIPVQHRMLRACCVEGLHALAGRVLLSCAQPRRPCRHRVRGQGVSCQISLLRCQQGARAALLCTPTCLTATAP